MSVLRSDSKKRLVAIGSIAILVLVFWDMASTTARFGTGATGLVTLAMQADDHSYNPFSRDSSFISPETAEWMLTNFDWPFAETQQPTVFCGTPQSYVDQVIAARSSYGPDSHPDPRMMRLLRSFIERGLPIEQRYCGFTPLHNAILFADFEAVQVLIDAGADPLVEISRPGRKSDGWNSLELAHHLNLTHPEDYSELVEYLAQFDKG